MKSRKELIETCVRLYESQWIMLKVRLGIESRALLVPQSPKLSERYERYWKACLTARSTSQQR